MPKQYPNTCSIVDPLEHNAYCSNSRFLSQTLAKVDMRKTALVVLAIVTINLGLRVLIVIVWDIAAPFWRISSIVTLLFAFAMLEIAWSKSQFQALEGMITALIASPGGPEPVRRWYRMSIRRMYDPRNSAISGTVSIPLIAFIMWYIDFNSWQPNFLLRWFDTVTIGLMFSAMAASQWPFVNITLFVARLARKNLVINFYSHPADSIMCLGSFLLKIDLGGIFLVGLLALGIYLLPVSVPLWVYGLVLIVFVWAVIWFFLTQSSIHKYMMREKRQRLGIVSNRLTAALDSVINSPGEEERRSYELAKIIYGDIASWPEWPFRPQNVVTLFSGVLIPMVIIALNVIKVSTGS